MCKKSSTQWNYDPDLDPLVRGSWSMAVEYNGFR